MPTKMGTLADWDALGLPRESAVIDARPRAKGHNNAPGPQRKQRPRQKAGAPNKSVSDVIRASRRLRGLD
jgi:hypothetical protein